MLKAGAKKARLAAWKVNHAHNRRKLGGRAIRSVPGGAARPAMARGINWDGLAALDLFAGTGSRAYEALSRAARA